jgi:hypothetical protein
MPVWYYMSNMKILFLLIIISSASFVSLLFLVIPYNHHDVQALCAYDKDWPQKPCYDELPGPSIIEKRDDWQKYYDSKGEDWMYMKKVEMNYAIKNGTLKKWIEYTSEPENYANYNVWYYYWINGYSPDPDGNYVSNIVEVRSGPSYFPYILAILGAGLILAYVLKKRR